MAGHVGPKPATPAHLFFPPWEKLSSESVNRDLMMYRSFVTSRYRLLGESMGRTHNIVRSVPVIVERSVPNKPDRKPYEKLNNHWGAKR